MLRVVHFEIPVDDIQRAITFYKQVFGWEFTKWEGGETEYWLIKTGDDGQMGINGGLMKRMMPADGESPAAFICTMDVPNYDTYLGKILKAGGRVVTQKTEIPKMGWMSYFKDTEGNTFGIMEMFRVWHVIILIMEEEQKQAGYGKRPLWQWIVLYAVIAVVIYGAVYFVLIKHQGGYSMHAISSMYPTATPKPTIGMKQKFSDSSDFQYGYKIFPGDVSATAKEAMAGFAFTKAMSDGSTQITLTSQNKYYKTQQYAVKPGYSLYFIERMMGDDDSEKDTDAKYTDDTAILVDPQGYIAQ